MNKQELIKKLEERRTIIGNFQGYAVWWKDVKEIFEQLGEPQPVKVPQFVADWIRKCKMFKHFAVSLSFALQPIVWEENGLSHECIEWLMDANNQELFARAWLDGYEVEKEKRYFVKIKGNIKENMLVYGELLEMYFFTKSFSLDDVIYSHTRKELEDANFGWVFDCPGIEIEEVEYDTNA
ncbi:phage protein [Streptococcus pneumoniae]|nr:phage protein [Streptococcus pneumoniae]